MRVVYVYITAARQERFGAGTKMSVSLRHGRGDRAEYNGMLATPIDGGAGGGWRNVEVKLVDGTAKRIRWRSSHWVPVENEATTLTALSTGSDGVLALLLSHCPLITVCSALRTCKHVLLSRNSPLTWADADFFEVLPGRRIEFARFIGQRHARICRLRIDIGYREYHIMRWLFSECVLTELRIADYSCRAAAEYCLSLGPSGPGAPVMLIDLDDGNPYPQTHVGFDCRVEIPEALSDCFEKFCPSLSSLSHSSHQSVRPCWSLPSLTSLDMVFMTADHLSNALARLPSLKHLTIRKTDYQLPYTLSHPLLETVDFRGAAKQATFTSIDCPHLRLLECSYYHDYGNGIRLVGPDARVLHRYNAIAEVEVDFSVLCTFASMRGEPISLPATCVVTWCDMAYKLSGTDSLRASPSTPLMKLVKELKARESLAKVKECLRLRLEQHNDPKVHRFGLGGRPIEEKKKLEAMVSRWASELTEFCNAT